MSGMKRQSTKVGRPRATFRASSISSGALKKTSKRGAYNRRRKQNFANRRRPFVETKNVTNEDLGGKTVGSQLIPDTTQFSTLTSGSNFELLVPHCYYVMRQGLDEGHMIGREIYSRILACKMTMRFPQGAKINNTPNQYELFYGWIPAPIYPTGTTQPTRNQYNSLLIQAHAITKIGEFFNNREDKLNWIPRGTDQIRIVGRKLIRPDLRHSLNPDGSDGYVPDYYTSFKWDVKHKLRYTPGQVATGTGVDCFALTQDWIPFVVVYNGELKDPTTGTQLNLPDIAYNFNHYFTDA